MEQKMQKNTEFKNNYNEFMAEYETLNHMNEVSSENGEDKRTMSNYLPHHAVLKAESVTTKLRVVFDASFKTSNGVSLNDTLLIGPKNQDDLWDIMIRFRQHKYVISADVAKMYRQILVHKDDRKYQQILWRKDPDKEIKRYELNTVTYGTSAAPYLATRCLKQLAITNINEYPEASQTILKNFYVDDLLTGGDTLDAVQKLKHDVTHILSTAGMELRKWNSNHKALMSETEGRHLDHNSLQTLPSTDVIPKTLGLRWNSEEDVISFNVNHNNNSTTTKREILSQISKLYDPLGVIAPLIVTAKVLMQKLWRLKSDWDSPVSEDILKEWSIFEKDLMTIQNIKIPRYVCLPHVIRIEIHTFADASEIAYGAVVYLLSSDNSNQTQCSLVCSKSRVAPLTSISLPKLELCAALLAARLCEKVRNTLTLSISKFTYWSDSTITLHWINSDPSRFKAFVANRISEIQQLTQSKEWRHVPSKQNAADIVSRGTTVEGLSTLWWNGPDFLLKDESQWPPQWPEHQRDLPLHESKFELKPIRALVVTTRSSNISAVISQFSSWSTCIRILSYCLRFTNKVRQRLQNTGHKEPSVRAEERPSDGKHNEPPSPLSKDEIERTIITVMRLVHMEEFKDEIHNLKNGNIIPRKSKLLPLNPFIDKDECLRVGGRLKHANIPVNQKHPLVLPSNHVVTRLILRSIHQRQLHCGAEQLLSTARLRYWPMSGRKLAREIVRHCPDCVRFSPHQTQYIMGNLPHDRVNAGIRPFTSVGVDFAGPIMIRESNRRGRRVTTKGYIAVFVCFSTKAAHLELVSSLTTECFLASLKRFIARRGIPACIYSDNGTNFVGANNELQEIVTFLQRNKHLIGEEASKLDINWKFQPPRAPSFGGLWETTVKSMKRHLYKVTHGCSFTFEETSTLLTQIESVLNSRPLSPLSTDPNDLTILTPAHFLIGDTLSEPPEYDYTQIEKTNRLSRYQHLQQIRQHFWRRWQRDYLHHLQARQKWKINDSTNIQV